jgi:hypothetical protein
MHRWWDTSTDLQRLLHETEDVGGDITNTYAAGTQNEFGDLIGEGDGQSHAYDAQADTDALLDSTGTVEARYKYTAFGEVDAVSLDGGAWSREDWQSLPLELSSHMLAGGRKHYYLDMETALYLLEKITGQVRFSGNNPPPRASAG